MPLSLQVVAARLLVRPHRLQPDLAQRNPVLPHSPNRRKSKKRTQTGSSRSGPGARWRLRAWMRDTRSIPRMQGMVSTAANLRETGTRTPRGFCSGYVSMNPSRARGGRLLHRFRARTLKSGTQANQPIGTLLLFQNVRGRGRPSQAQWMPPPVEQENSPRNVLRSPQRLSGRGLRRPSGATCP